MAVTEDDEEVIEYDPLMAFCNPQEPHSRRAQERIQCITETERITPRNALQSNCGVFQFCGDCLGVLERCVLRTAGPYLFHE